GEWFDESTNNGGKESINRVGSGIDTCDHTCCGRYQGYGCRVANIITRDANVGSHYWSHHSSRRAVVDYYWQDIKDVTTDKGCDSIVKWPNSGHRCGDGFGRCQFREKHRGIKN